MTKTSTFFLISFAAVQSLACGSENVGPAQPPSDAGASTDAGGQSDAPEPGLLAGIYKSSTDTTLRWPQVSLEPHELGLQMDNSYTAPGGPYSYELEQIELHPDGDGWRGTRLKPSQCGCTNVCWVEGTVASYRLTSPAEGTIRVEIEYFSGEWDPRSQLGIWDFSASGCLERDYPAIPLDDPHLVATESTDLVVAERCPDSSLSGSACSKSSDCCTNLCSYGACK